MKLFLFLLIFTVISGCAAYPAGYSIRSMPSYDYYPPYYGGYNSYGGYNGYSGYGGYNSFAPGIFLEFGGGHHHNFGGWGRR